MPRFERKLLWCGRTGTWTLGAAVLALLCAVLCCCCLASAAVDDEPLVLHASLVDLLNTENGLWAVSFSTRDPADPRAVWIAMREVQVEMQPSESASSLFFMPPSSLSSTPHHWKNAKEKKSSHDAAAAERTSATVDSDVFTRTYRPGPFGRLATSLHGLSCEEYKVGGQGQQNALHGRCYFLRDDGGDFFVRYEVKIADAQARGGNDEGAEAAHTHTSIRRHRQTGARKEGVSSLQANISRDGKLSESGQRIVHSTSRSGMWIEHVPIPAGSAGASEDHVRIGDVVMDEYTREIADARRSKQTVLTLTMAISPKDAASVVGDSGAVTHIRLECATGAFHDDALSRSALAVKASHTTLFRRWMWPVVFVATIYAVVAATAYLVSWRQSSQGSMTSATSGATKKHQ